MKTLNEYLNEDFFKNIGSTPEDNKRRKTIPLIEVWLKEYNIKNYSINKDITIDIAGNIELIGYRKKQLPEYIRFNRVSGNFNIEYADLETLNGLPKEVTGNFVCNYCKNLENLEGAPEKVGEDFACYYCNNLKTLKGAPEKIERDFVYYKCRNLKEDPKEFLKSVVKGQIIK